MKKITLAQTSFGKPITAVRKATLWEVKVEGGGDQPKIFQGKFTSMPRVKEAVAAYIAEGKAKDIKEPLAADEGPDFSAQEEPKKTLGLKKKDK